MRGHITRYPHYWDVARHLELRYYWAEADAGGGDIINQEDVPTVVDQAEEEARLSETDSDQGWSSHPEPSPIQGTEELMSIDSESQISKYFA
jgi:hypothetical protein